MPYFISDTAEGCDGWATVKEDGEVLGCHVSKQDAIDQALAIAQSEGSTFEGERAGKKKNYRRDLPENYRPATSDDVPEGRACGNCIFFNEDNLDDEGRAFCERWEEYVEGGQYCNAWEPRADSDDDEDDDEIRQVDLTPPAYMRAAARQGLAYHEQGLSGDGVVDRTIREARAMADGSMTVDKWVRTAAWIARHLVDLDAPAADPESDAYPSPGVVAHLLWGSGPSKRGAQRALDYAEGVVGRIEAENEGRAKGEALKKMETRVNPAQFELRELEEGGMTFEGYAAVFNSPSEPLPFTERIAPGAFKRSLQARNDIKLLWNHDSGSVLGSTRAGTLTMVEDDRGLKVRAELPNTSLGRDTAELIRRGDVDSMSFGFSVIRDSWDESGNERTLHSVRIHEASIVAFPAYRGTAGTTSVRGLDKIAQRANVDADELADALLKIETGDDLSTDEAELLSRVIKELAPEDEVAGTDSVGDLGLLALKKKKLELLERF
jgi:HK97 family phage prohead protease